MSHEVFWAWISKWIYSTEKHEKMVSLARFAERYESCLKEEASKSESKSTDNSDERLHFPGCISYLATL
jgi:hypothetical protein